MEPMENLEDTRELTAAEIMNGDVPALSPDATIADVLRTMVQHDTAGVVVVEGNEIIGIITESDIVARQADVDAPVFVPFLDAIFAVDAGRQYHEEIRRALATSARELMSSPVTSIRSQATLEEIATVMLDRDVHPLPVVDDDNRYMGVVSRRDLVRVIARLETHIS